MSKQKKQRVWVAPVKRSGHILVGLRSPKCNNPNTWGLFGGQVESGEYLAQAALRELSEEAGLVWTPSVLREVIITDWNGKQCAFFTVDADGLSLKDLKPTEEVSKFMLVDVAGLTAQAELGRTHYSVNGYLEVLRDVRPLIWG